MILKSLSITAAIFATCVFSIHAEPSAILRDTPLEETLVKRDDIKPKAYTWAILGTVVPTGAAYILSNSATNDHSTLVGWLVVGGLFVGPSLGQFYAQAPGQGVLGIGIRGIGAVLGIIGVAQSLAGAFCGIDFGGNDKECPEPKNGTPLIIIGSVTYLGGLFYSLIDTGRAVDRLRYHSSESQFGWMPTLIPGKDGATRTGLSAWMRF